MMEETPHRPRLARKSWNGNGGQEKAAKRLRRAASPMGFSPGRPAWHAAFPLVPLLLLPVGAALPVLPAPAPAGGQSTVPETNWLTLQTAGGPYDTTAALQWSGTTYRVAYDFARYMTTFREDLRRPLDPDATCYAPDDCPNGNIPNYYAICCDYSATIVSYLWNDDGQPLGCFKPSDGYTLGEADKHPTGAMNLIAPAACGEFPADPLGAGETQELHWFIAVVLHATATHDGQAGFDFGVGLVGTILGIAISLVVTAGTAGWAAVVAIGLFVTSYFVTENVKHQDFKVTTAAFINNAWHVPIAYIDLFPHQGCDSRSAGRDTWDAVEHVYRLFDRWYDQGEICFLVVAYNSPLGIEGTLRDEFDYVPKASSAFLREQHGDSTHNSYTVASTDLHSVTFDGTVSAQVSTVPIPDWFIASVGAVWDFEWAEEISPKVDAMVHRLLDDQTFSTPTPETIELWLSSYQQELACGQSQGSAASSGGSPAPPGTGHAPGSQVVWGTLAINACAPFSFEGDNTFVGTGTANGLSEGTQTTTTVSTQIHVRFDLIPHVPCLINCHSVDENVAYVANNPSQVQGLIASIKEAAGNLYAPQELRFVVLYEPHQSPGRENPFHLLDYADATGLRPANVAALDSAGEGWPLPAVPIVPIIVTEPAY